MSFRDIVMPQVFQIHSDGQTWTGVFLIGSAMAADDLALQVGRASIAMILTCR